MLLVLVGSVEPDSHCHLVLAQSLAGAVALSVMNLAIPHVHSLVVPTTIAGANPPANTPALDVGVSVALGLDPLTLQVLIHVALLGTPHVHF